MDLRDFFQQNNLRTSSPIINNFGIGSVTHPIAQFQSSAEDSSTLFQKVWNGTKLTTRFIVTTLLIFGVIQVSLNFPAYKQKYDYFREKQSGVKDPKKEILKSLQKAPTSATVSTTQVAQAATNSVEESFTLRKEVINFHNYEVTPSDNRVIIGKIGKNVPIVQVADDKLLKQDFSGLEQDIQDALLHGIVHYPGTAEPGQIGNAFFTGHSSNYVWVNSNYNNVLALAEELVVGDKVTIYWENKKFIYQVYDIKVVAPQDTWVLQQSGNEYPSIMTLMTCTPIGTSLKRLIIRSKQIYPDPAHNTAPDTGVINPTGPLVSS
ncbi:MAG: sortase [Candidatus Abawacabacteria bacterium]|nr:sortase [Candidatus Abawacabacteria bacterium]